MAKKTPSFEEELNDFMQDCSDFILEGQEAAIKDELGKFLAGKVAEFCIKYACEHPEEVLGKVFGEKTIKNSKINLSVFSDLYEGYDTVTDVVGIAQNIAQFIEGYGDYKFFSDDPDIRSEALYNMTKGVLGLSKTVLETIPICGPVYGFIVGELSAAFDAGYNVIKGRVDQLKYTEYMCDYYAGYITASQLYDKVKKLGHLKNKDEIEAKIAMEALLESKGMERNTSDPARFEEWRKNGDDIFEHMDKKEKKKYGQDSWKYDTNEEKKEEQGKNYGDSNNTPPPKDPLIIDLGREKIELTTVKDGVYFDLDRNGLAEKTAWTTGEDGFLALDRNGNGVIDDGGELFGDRVTLKDGSNPSSGFEALAEFDDNGDGVIDKKDKIFSDLLVWVDKNHDGISTEDELMTLEELGIKSISLDHENENTNNNGTLVTESANVTFEDGSVRKISEHWFNTNSFDTTDQRDLTDGMIISSVDSFGNVMGLNNAIFLDETGELGELVERFKTSEDYVEKRILIKRILYFLTDAFEITPGSRGGNIDARDLRVIEQFMGAEYDGVDGTSPNVNAAAILKDIYADLENMYFNLLNDESVDSDALDSVRYSWEGSKKTLDITSFIEDIERRIAEGQDPENALMFGASWLYEYDSAFGTDLLGQVRSHFADYAPMLDRINGLSVIIGGNANDILSGTANDDTIYGGAGDDILSGGAGNDSYYFDKNHGNDIINDNSGKTTLVFSDGLKESDYTTGITVSGDKIGFALINKETGDTISLPDFLADPTGYEFLFDGFASSSLSGSSREIIEGTDGDDYLEAGNGFNIFYGGEGDDTILGGDDIDFMYGGEGDDILYGGNGTNVMYGGAGNDIIYDGDDGSYLSGGDGDDMLYGGGGADVLDGGAGNDYLQGDHGNDTYIFGKGYDIDTIAASSDLHTVVIHDYSVSDMHNVREMNNDLVIDFGTDTGDRLILKSFFDYNSNRDYKFVFDDGTVLGQYDIKAVSAPIIGTDGDDHLYGTNGADVLDGGAGNDILNGGDGEDTYIFAKGYDHDTINEWGSDHSFVDLRDINSDEITVSDQWGSNLLISVNGTEDVLTVSNFKWGQATYTFRFADGAEGYVDKNTWQLVLTKQPDPTPEEEDMEQTGAELLDELYSSDASELAEEMSAIISDVTESASISGEGDRLADMTDIQALLLAENMSAFGGDSQISDGIGFGDITSDASALDQLLVSSSVQ